MKLFTKSQPKIEKTVAPIKEKTPSELGYKSFGEVIKFQKVLIRNVPSYYTVIKQHIIEGSNDLSNHLFGTIDNPNDRSIKSMNECMERESAKVNLWIAITEQKRTISPGVRGFTGTEFKFYRQDMPLEVIDALDTCKGIFDYLMILEPGLTESVTRTDPILVGFIKNDPTPYMIVHWD